MTQRFVQFNRKQQTHSFIDDHPKRLSIFAAVLLCLQNKVLVLTDASRVNILPTRKHWNCYQLFFLYISCQKVYGAVSLFLHRQVHHCFRWFQISYGTRIVEPGMVLTPTDVKDLPVITYDAEPDAFYTLIMNGRHDLIFALCSTAVDFSWEFHQNMSPEPHSFLFLRFK